MVIKQPQRVQAHACVHTYTDTHTLTHTHTEPTQQTLSWRVNLTETHIYDQSNRHTHEWPKPTGTGMKGPSDRLMHRQDEW